jgi:hypothetical protein
MVTGYDPEKYAVVRDCVQPVRPLHNKYKNSGTIAIMTSIINAPSMHIQISSQAM